MHRKDKRICDRLVVALSSRIAQLVVMGESCQLPSQLPQTRLWDRYQHILFIRVHCFAKWVEKVGGGGGRGQRDSANGRTRKKLIFGPGDGQKKREAPFTCKPFQILLSCLVLSEIVSVRLVVCTPSLCSLTALDRLLNYFRINYVNKYSDCIPAQNRLNFSA